MPFFCSDEGGFTTWQHPQLGLYLRKLDELRGAAAQKAQAAQAALHQQALHAQQLQLQRQEEEARQRQRQEEELAAAAIAFAHGQPAAHAAAAFAYGDQLAGNGGRGAHARADTYHAAHAADAYRPPPHAHAHHPGHPPPHHAAHAAHYAAASVAGSYDVARQPSCGSDAGSAAYAAASQQSYHHHDASYDTNEYHHHLQQLQQQEQQRQHVHGGQYAYADAPASVAGSYDPPSTVGDAQQYYAPSQQYYAHAPPSDAAYDCAQRGSDAASTHYGGGGHGGSCQHGAPAASTVGDGGSEATFMAEALAAAHAAYGSSSIAGDGLQPLPDDAPATPRNPWDAEEEEPEGFVQVDAWENRHSEQQEALAEKQRARWNAALAKLATPPKSGTPPRRAVARTARPLEQPHSPPAAAPPPRRRRRSAGSIPASSGLVRSPPAVPPTPPPPRRSEPSPPPPSSPPRRGRRRRSRRHQRARRSRGRRGGRARPSVATRGGKCVRDRRAVGRRRASDSSDGSDADEELPSLAEMTAPLAAMVGGVIQRTGAADSAREKVAPVLRPCCRRSREESPSSAAAPASTPRAPISPPSRQRCRRAASRVGGGERGRRHRACRAPRRVGRPALVGGATTSQARAAGVLATPAARCAARRRARRAVAVASAKVDAVAAELAGDSAAEFAAEVGAAADDDGDAAAALPGAGALRAASEGRQRQSQRHLLAFEHRLASLEATGGADGASPGRGGGEAAALAARWRRRSGRCGRLIRRRRSSSSRSCGAAALRGEKLKAKVAEEVAMLREQWREHKLRLQAAAREERATVPRAAPASHRTRRTPPTPPPTRPRGSSRRRRRRRRRPRRCGDWRAAGRRPSPPAATGSRRPGPPPPPTPSDAPLRFLGEMSALYDSLSRQIRREVRIVCGMYRRPRRRPLRRWRRQRRRPPQRRRPQRRRRVAVEAARRRAARQRARRSGGGARGARRRLRWPAGAGA